MSSLLILRYFFDSDIARLSSMEPNALAASPAVKRTRCPGCTRSCPAAEQARGATGAHSPGGGGLSAADRRPGRHRQRAACAIPSHNTKARRRYRSTCVVVQRCTIHCLQSVPSITFFQTEKPTIRRHTNTITTTTARSETTISHTHCQQNLYRTTVCILF